MPSLLPYAISPTDQPWYSMGGDYPRVRISAGKDHWGAIWSLLLLWWRTFFPTSSETHQQFQVQLVQWECLQPPWVGGSPNNKWLTDRTPMFELLQELLIQAQMDSNPNWMWKRRESESKERLFSWDSLYIPKNLDVEWSQQFFNS